MRLHDRWTLPEHLAAARFAAWHDTQFDPGRAFALRQAAPFPITLSHHALSYASLLHDRFLRLLLCHPQPHDAVICVSHAARRALENILQRVAEDLGRTLGASLAYRGQLVEIPFGVDIERFWPRDRQPTRCSLGLPEAALILLWLGRFSAIDKADLLPLLDVFARLLLCCGADHPGQSYTDVLRTQSSPLGIGAQVMIYDSPKPPRFSV